jgi:predicted phosphoribosyltransferase
MTPDYFNAISVWYQDFTQTTDAEVRELLKNAPEEPGLNVGEFVTV